MDGRVRMHAIVKMENTVIALLDQLKHADVNRDMLIHLHATLVSKKQQSFSKSGYINIFYVPWTNSFVYELTFIHI